MKICRTKHTGERLNIRYSRSRGESRIAARGWAVYISLRALLAETELAVVLMLTGAAFSYGQQAALQERGHLAYGGEYLLLVLPAIYYAGKKIVKDIAADVREYRKGSDHERTL